MEIYRKKRIEKKTLKVIIFEGVVSLWVKKQTNFPTVTTCNENYTEGFSQCTEAKKIKIRKIKLIKSIGIRKKATNLSFKDYV